MLGQVSPITDNRPPFVPTGSASPEVNRPGTGYNKGRALTMPYHSPKDAMGSPYARMTNTPPTGYPNGAHPNGVDYMHHDPNGYHMSGQRPHHQSPNPQRPSIQTNVGPYGVLSPISNQPGYHSQPTNTPQSSATMPYVTPQNFPPFSLPPSEFNAPPSATASREEQQTYVPSTSAEYSDPHHQNGEMIMLDQMTIQQTMPVFGSESVLNKSPYVGMPEDFMAYLFNTHGEGSPMTGVPIQGYKSATPSAIT